MNERLNRCFPPRAADSHKGTYGTLFSLCGSYTMAGAAILAARAAYRCGVGLTVCAVPDRIYPLVAGAVPEAVFAPYDTDPLSAYETWAPKITALLIGCGLGRTADHAVHHLLERATVPIILDADGINAVAGHIVIPKADSASLVLTPHPAELARLLGTSVKAVQQDREGAAVQAAKQFHATVALKGHRTVVADETGVLFINSTGNAGMATAGSGDVLAGMIGAFLAQGLSAADAAVCGVYLHGAAGDLAAEELSRQSLMASDLITALPNLFSQIERE